MFVNDLRRAYETLVAIRSRENEISYEEWDALITASAVVRVKLEDAQAALAKQCDPWFRVQ